MKFNVDQILDLPEIKVLNFQELEEVYQFWILDFGF